MGSNIKLGNAGVITATSFVGSGAALTGIDATAIKDSGGNVKIQAQASGAIHTGVSTFQDLTVEKSGNLNVNIKSTGGWEALEVGGATAGYIDIKKPFSDDFDLRLMVDGTGTNYIASNAANLNLNAQGNNGIEIGAYGAPSLKYSNDTKLVTTSAGVSIPKDLDVDGHTNLDNVSIAGVTTTTGILRIDSGNLQVYGTAPTLFLRDTDNNPDYRLFMNSHGSYKIFDETNGVDRFIINPNGKVSILYDLDVDGHTNLDNVSIAGVTTFAQKINLSDNFIRDFRGFNSK